MLAGTLYELLEERKLVRTREELEKLASRYEIDVGKLESVARFVNSPSVDEGSVRKEVDRDGVEQVKMKVSLLNMILYHLCYYVTEYRVFRLPG